MLSRLGFLAGAMALLGACGELPRDSGALERIRSSGELRVGAVDDPPWIAAGTGTPSGHEAVIVQQFAADLGVRVRYVAGSEADLVEALHKHEIDVLAAGWSAKAPYAKRVAVTQPYYKAEKALLRATHEPEAEKQRVFAVIPGESGLLYRFDRFLLERRSAWKQLIETAPAERPR